VLLSLAAASAACADDCSSSAGGLRDVSGVPCAREARTSRGVEEIPGRLRPSIRIQSVAPCKRFLTSLAGEQLGGPQSDFVIVEWADSGESGYEWIAPLHVHHADDEAWYVLEGMLRFRIGDEVREVGPRGAVLAPKGTPHAYGNARHGLPARYLLVMTPKLRRLVRALHEPGAGDYREIFRAHDSELLD
jgi:mannose-6-phosphate isomerase-like protein (cupin superfamily)